MQCLPRDDRSPFHRHQGAGRIVIPRSGLRAEAVGDPVVRRRRALTQPAGMEGRFMRAIMGGVVWFCACEGASAQAIPLRYGQAYSALRSIFALPLLVAEREGYFVREGLDFSMLPVPGGGERLIAALNDG